MLYTKGKVLLGKYQIIKMLGQGGTAQVYIAQGLIGDQEGKYFAVKAGIKSSVSNAEERLIQEGNLLKNLNHKNVVKGYDVGFEEGKVVIVMEYIHGLDLKQLQKKLGKFSMKQMLKVLIQLIDGMKEIHSKGVLHRDLTPDNIMLTKNNVVKIMDFGAVYTDEQNNFTREGSAIGKVEWMAPEQLYANGPKANFQTDIFSLGALIYWMLVGTTPYRGRYTEVIRAIKERPVTPLKTLDFSINSEISKFVSKILERKPEDRYKTIEELEHDLNLILRGESPFDMQKIEDSKRKAFLFKLFKKN